MPGDPIDLMRSADPRMTAEDVARLKAVYGVDQPLLARYLAWAGRALRRGQAAGRSAVLWLSVPNLFVLPFGTALGVYALWVLLHNESRARFHEVKGAAL